MPDPEIDPEIPIAQIILVPGFVEFLIICSKRRDFVEAYDKLQGSDLAFNGSSIEWAIDTATERQDAELQQFIRFVHNIYCRLPPAP